VLRRDAWTGIVRDVIEQQVALQVERTAYSFFGQVGLTDRLDLSVGLPILKVNAQARTASILHRLGSAADPSIFLPRMRRVDLPDGPGAVGAALQALDAVTADWPHVRAVQRDLHLVIDEIVSNILKSARAARRSVPSVGGDRRRGSPVTLVFEDNGPPFNPPRGDA
jgi:hypothetical protein